LAPRHVTVRSRLWAVLRLPAVLAKRGDIDALTARADAGDTMAAQHLADVLAERGDIQALTARAEAGDTAAARHLALVLAKRGDIEALTALADARHIAASRRQLADVKAERIDALIAGEWLADVLAERGDIQALLVHGDLHGYNQLWDHGSGRLASVLDFEEAGVEEAEFDFRYLPGTSRTPELTLSAVSAYENAVGRARPRTGARLERPDPPR
jgi:Ser/Thr protein kinase RdoA (MazF antagonist)